MKIKKNDAIEKRNFSTFKKSNKLISEKTKIKERIKRKPDFDEYDYDYLEKDSKESAGQDVADVVDCPINFYEKLEDQNGKGKLDYSGKVITDEELKNLNGQDYFDNLKKEIDVVGENKKFAFNGHNKHKRYVNYENEDEYVLEDYEDFNQKNENDPGFIDHIYNRISSTRSYLITPEKIEKNIKSFLGQFEISRKKARLSIRMYKMLWNAVRRTVKVLNKCEIESIDIDYYVTSFSKRNNPYGSLDSDDPFYPFYNFVKDFVSYEVQKKDFDELNSESNLMDQPLIKTLMTSFINFVRSYEASIDKEQKVIADITNNSKKVITDDEKRAIHNLLFEHVISMRKIFDFSNCRYSFQRQLIIIDDLINLTNEKLNKLNTECINKQNYLEINKNIQNSEVFSSTDEKHCVVWNPEINYKPGITKNEKMCKEIVFKKSTKKFDPEVFDCVNSTLKIDKESSSIEEDESFDYLINDNSSVINGKNNPFNYEKFDDEPHLDYLDYSNDQPVALGLVKSSSQLTQSASVISGIYSFFLFYEYYFIIGFFLLLSIVFCYLIRKMIWKRKKVLNAQYSRCSDKNDLPIKDMKLFEIKPPKENFENKKPELLNEVKIN